MATEQTTNEDLARMIAAGFANTATKQDIHDVDERLTRVETKLEDIEDRVKITETKLDKALYKETERITKLENWAKKVGEKVGVRISI